MRGGYKVDDCQKCWGKKMELLYRPHPLPLLLTIAILLLAFMLPHKLGNARGSETATVSFAFPDASNSTDDGGPPADFLFLGNTKTENGVIELALDGSVGGAVLSRKPFRMFDPATGEMASFSTYFSFSISTRNTTASSSSPSAGSDGYGAKKGGDGDGDGDNDNDNNGGFEFVFCTDDYKPGEYGGRLGVFSGGPKAKYFGLDVTNVTSTDTNDGGAVKVWITFDGPTARMQLRTHAPDADPLLDVIAAYYLRDTFHEWMYAGFSSSSSSSSSAAAAATLSTNRFGTILAWNISVWGLPESHPPRPLSPPVASKTGVIAGISVAVTSVVALITLASLAFARRHFRKRRLVQSGYMKRTTAATSEAQTKFGPRPFSYKELHRATQGFSEAELLLCSVDGGGTDPSCSSSSVFRGVLEYIVGDGDTMVAIKHVSRATSQQGLLKYFLQEVVSLCSIRHRNLVPLLGWCGDKGELLLVYEFVPGGSLDSLLFHGRNPLPWASRYSIVGGVASALHYLHERWDQCIIHRNVKASNVMLDHNLNPKLGDYGLAHLLVDGGNRGHVVAGTFGYVAPEAVSTGRTTVKTDVFGFGAVALEVACGRRAFEPGMVPAPEAVLSEWAWQLHSQGRLLEAADPRLQGCFDVDEMLRLLHLGLLCSHPDPDQRPLMSTVDRILASEEPLPTLPPCKPLTSSTVVSSQEKCINMVSIEELLAETTTSSSSKSSLLEMTASSSQQL